MCCYNRLSWSDPAMWKDIFEFNKTHLENFNRRFQVEFCKLLKDQDQPTPRPAVFESILHLQKTFSAETISEFHKIDFKLMLLELTAFLACIDKGNVRTIMISLFLH